MPPGYGKIERVTKPEASFPFQVYGIDVLVQLLAEAPAGFKLYCPKGSPIRYGAVVARGDGFDEGANGFREMPPLGVVVAFEESAEDVEGHYFYHKEQEYRILRLDAVILSYPSE